MNSKKKLLEKSGLYVIIDKEVWRRRPKFSDTKIKDLPVDIIQLRDKISDKETVLKDALRLRRALSNTGIIFIINDYLDIARLIDSDGVHLGQDDLPIGIARRLLGKDKIIGVSCHSLKQAKSAEVQGADYISIGPVFSTPTKPEYKPVGLGLIREISQEIKIPFFAIGGINEKNIGKVLDAGAKRIAVCSLR
ncbi:MAG: thiamine phosphate synthase [Candidatus Omnitrophica bacterium]|nr:thiamine phosphate synthase [Candidatus Omnitrophota bacterium]MBU4473438.1 thiamine phosphate synthase [Candidatus Omnitrophota bacterium]